MFLDWKNQYCENDYTTQSNLQIQCNPYQTTNGIFHRTRTKIFTICMETQKIPNSQSNRFCLFVCLFFGGMWASHCCGLSHCGAQALDAQAQRPWLTGPAARRHVGSSRTGTQTCVPCIGRWTLSHCTTTEAPDCAIFYSSSVENAMGSLIGIALNL